MFASISAYNFANWDFASSTDWSPEPIPALELVWVAASAAGGASGAAAATGAGATGAGSAAGA
jgi:hypothetical protein